MSNEDETEFTITGRSGARVEPLPPGEYAMQLASVFDGIAPAPSGRARVMRLNFELLHGDKKRRIQDAIRRLR